MFIMVSGLVKVIAYVKLNNLFEPWVLVTDAPFCFCSVYIPDLC